MLSFETTCAFFVASLLMAMTPGPDVIIVLTQSSLYGMRAGVFTTLGLMTGLLGQRWPLRSAWPSCSRPRRPRLRR